MKAKFPTYDGTKTYVHKKIEAVKAKRRQANKQVHKIKSSSNFMCFRLFHPTLEANSLEVLQQRHLAVLLDLVQRDGVEDGLDQAAVVRQDKDPAEEEEEELKAKIAKRYN